MLILQYHIVKPKFELNEQRKHKWLKLKPISSNSS